MNAAINNNVFVTQCGKSLNINKAKKLIIAPINESTSSVVLSFSYFSLS